MLGVLSTISNKRRCNDKDKLRRDISSISRPPLFFFFFFLGGGSQKTNLKACIITFQLWHTHYGKDRGIPSHA